MNTIVTLTVALVLAGAFIYREASKPDEPPSLQDVCNDSEKSVCDEIADTDTSLAGEVARYLKAVAQGDGGAVCSEYTPALRRRVASLVAGNRSCTETLLALPRTRDPEVLSQTIQAAALHQRRGRATVTFHQLRDRSLYDLAGGSLSLHMDEVVGSWVIDGVKDDSRGGLLGTR